MARPRTAKITGLTYDGGKPFVNGTSLTQASHTITAQASNTVKVIFTRDGYVVGTDTASPFTFTWTSTAAGVGAHTLSAVPVNSRGTQGAKVTVSFTVAAAPPPPPVIMPAYAAWTQVTGATGYKISWGTISRTYPYTADCGSTTMFQVPNLTQGVHYFLSGQSYDATGTSSYGNEVSITL